MRAGKVYMQSPDGDERMWVGASEVPYWKSKKATVVQSVRMSISGPDGNIVRDFPGGAVPFRWQPGADVPRGFGAPHVADAGEVGTSVPQSLVNTGKRMAAFGVEQVPTALSALVPGVGAGPSALRALTMLGSGTPANMASDAIRGQKPDPMSAFTRAGVSALTALPFEAGAALMPKWAPKGAASALRPTKRQIEEMRQVAERQNQTYVQPDYELAGKNILDEGVIPGKEGLATVHGRNEADTNALEGILASADAAGWTTVRGRLAASPEIKALRSELAKESGDPRGSIAYLNRYLRNFTTAPNRFAPGTPRTPAVPPQKRNPPMFDQFGNPMMTQGSPMVPGVPSRQIPQNATDLTVDQRIWRKESAPVLKAREQGTSGDKLNALEARISDALARAAKTIKDNTISQRVADPVNRGRTVGLTDVEARLERRIPVQDALEDYSKRVPMSATEHIWRLMRGHVPPGMEAHLALAASAPDFANKMRALGVMAPMNTTKVLGGGQ